jgi:hypothetical protein
MLDIFVTALVTWQVVEIWHHSQLFAGRRASLQVRSGLLAELLLCPFCLSVWVAWIVMFCLRFTNLMMIVMTLYQASWDSWTSLALVQGAGEAARVIFGGLAASRLANLGNDLSHPWCRTPKNVI